MRARILINKNSQAAAAECLKACFAILDKVVKVKMSKSCLAKCEYTRKKVDSQKNKEKEEEKAMKSAMAAREQELKYQEKLRSLPIAEQQRLEEKRRQQDIKQQKKKM